MYVVGYYQVKNKTRKNSEANEGSYLNLIYLYFFHFYPRRGVFHQEHNVAINTSPT